MDRARAYPDRTQRSQAIGVTAEWGKTFLTQSLVAVLLALLWALLGLQ